MTDEEKDDETPSEIIMQDIEQDQLGDEEIPQQSSKKVYRLLSLLIIISMLFVFVLPPLINSIVFLQTFRGNDLEPGEAQELLGYFEENYLYQELFEEETYHQKKQKLLSRNSISRMRLHLFIKNMTNHVGDQYTYFSGNTQKPNTKSPSIESEIIDENTYYIRLHEFNEGIAEKTKRTLVKSTHPNLIIDLRGNPGGNLRELLGIAELFLPENIEAFRLEGSNQLQSFITREEMLEPYKRVFILLDKKSASASEILALTMKLNMENVVVIGKETVGKSVAQTEQKDSNDTYSFSIVSYRWFVQNESVDHLQNYLLEYKDVRLNNLDDYIKVVNRIIKKFN
ncbi:peptidase S41 [Alkaliphilus metalliredigens QYMF]|uniref:Peptidase S41 n=2 Tax=Alkaliphilus TaxID=114627 RepID=A6TSB7_ALKMQ|nr:peptidase S41 [Alkaliphilus metalliredigens QYMF]